MKNLLLITGAGASYDIVNNKFVVTEENFTPPLTKNLFASGYRDIADIHQYVSDCLKRHPLAAQVGYDFALKSTSGDEVSLEEYLRELKESNQIMLRNQYWAVPLYLYELFYNISNKYLPTGNIGLPSNYKTLINEVAKSSYTQIIWLNLNYDLFADYAIKSSDYTNKLDKFDDYMKIKTQDNLRIKYTKPHGSVDWFRRINDFNGIWEDVKNGKVPANFEAHLSSQIYKKGELLNKKEEVDGIEINIFPDKCYPAVSVPIGQYEYIYRYHIDEIIPELKSTTSVLCVGFNALDEDILELVEKYIPKIDKLKIVNGRLEGKAGETAYERIARHCNNLNVRKEDALFDGGFSDFIPQDLAKWISMTSITV